ncbi:MAG: DUF1292 domain-containing protein [Evtepia gabavorous]
MSEEYGANFITVTDEEGNEFELEHLDTIEFQGQTYLAFFPAVQDGEEAQNEEEMGLVISKQSRKAEKSFPLWTVTKRLTRS